MISNDSSSFFTYILTNKNKTVLYTGVTNDLQKRLIEHFEGVQQKSKSFTAKYQCVYLVYYEKFIWVQDAIAREKQIKSWIRRKKIALIQETNPTWHDLLS